MAQLLSLWAFVFLGMLGMKPLNNPLLFGNFLHSTIERGHSNGVSFEMDLLMCGF